VKREEDGICYQVKFGNVYTGFKPMTYDAQAINIDKSQKRWHPYFPHEARIRNLTYQIESKVDVWVEKRYRHKKKPGDLVCKPFPTVQIELAKIPVMIRSTQCHLSDCNEQNIMRQKECLYDQGGYFIVNGSEKVIVAQERQACNIVLVFNDNLPTSKYSFNV
jgi:DNA-directed RNA polymerase II subunit RPB2